jgi:hypothetical protein
MIKVEWWTLDVLLIVCRQMDKSRDKKRKKREVDGQDSFTKRPKFETARSRWIEQCVATSTALIKEKIKLSSYMRKFKRERLQSHI